MVVLIIIAAGLGYYQIIVYPPNHTSTTTTYIPPDPHNVTVTIVPSASSECGTIIGMPQSQCNGKTYVPDAITVVIGYNATVIWRNNQTATPHTVTAELNDSGIDPRFLAFGPESPPSSWNVINYGQTVNFTFIKPGTYVYYCSYHSWMIGAVTVLAASNSSATATGSTTTSSSSAMLSPYSLSWFTIAENQTALLWMALAFLASTLVISNKNLRKTPSSVIPRRTAFGARIV